MILPGRHAMIFPDGRGFRVYWGWSKSKSFREITEAKAWLRQLGGGWSIDNLRLRKGEH